MYPGEVTTQHGAVLEVKLTDGRQVKCKVAGRLKKARVLLRVGDVVSVQYLLDVDEDLQTPTIVSRTN